jgi:hypothetical protein
MTIQKQNIKAIGALFLFANQSFQFSLCMHFE